MAAVQIIWFRRDLRLADQPTLLAAAERADTALAVFVLDDRLLAPSGRPRRIFLAGCLRELHDELGGRLLIIRGDPVAVIPELAAAVGADAVHIAADHGPYGAARDRAVEAALGAVPLIRTGSAYAVSPGRLRTAAGTPYRVFTPFRRAWLEHGTRAPAATGPDTLTWAPVTGLPHGLGIDRAAELLTGDPAGRDLPDPDLPTPGERAAQRVWRGYRAGSPSGLDDYAARRDRPDLDATTRLSAYLKFGCIHPRTLLADIAGNPGSGAVMLRSELAWRDFYADVLHHRPDTARIDAEPRLAGLRHDTGSQAEEMFDAWRSGRTGYPIVDAGMRQLLAQGWMHNRVRMITASFLTKDLHLPWQRGARHFMTHLVDADLASNQHGWQWTAGTGTDAAPYFRVFNPTVQGEKFDPDGDYVRRWIPELRHLPGKAVHRPWRADDAADLFTDADGPGYPAPIVDHDHERREALARYGVVRGRD